MRKYYFRYGVQKYKYDGESYVSREESPKLPFCVAAKNEKDAAKIAYKVASRERAINPHTRITLEQFREIA